MTHLTPDELDQQIDQRAGADIDPATRQVVDALHTLADHPPLREEFAASLERRLLTEAQSLASSLSRWKRMQITVVDLVQRLKDPHPNPLPQGEGVKTWPTDVVTALAALAVVVALFFIMRPLASQPGTVAAPTAIPQADIGLPLGTLTPAVLGTVAPGQRWPLLATPTPFVPTLVPGPVTFEGRLGAQLDRPTEPAAYPLHQCDGSVMPVLENYPGQLAASVGQVIRVRAQIGGTGVDPTAGVYGPTILSVEAAPDLCPTGTPLPPGQPTPAPTGTPFVYAGRLTARVDNSARGAVFALSQCGNAQPLLLREHTPGQLEAFVGQDIIAVIATHWYAPPMVPQPQVDYVVLFVQTAQSACPTPAPTAVAVDPTQAGATATPLPMRPAPLLPTGDPRPLATPWPVIAVGRVGAATRAADQGVYYAFERCDGAHYRLIEGRPGLFDTLVGQVVQIIAEPRGIPSEPTQAPVLYVFQVDGAPDGCQSPKATSTSASLTDLHEWRSPDGQWVASVFISQPLTSGPNAGHKPVQFMVRHTALTLEWTVVDDFVQSSGWLWPAPQYWARDSQTLYFGVGFEVRRVELTTGKVTTVAQDVARVSQVSPDETRLAYIDWKSRLTVRQLVGEGMQQIQVEGLQDAAHVHDLVWSPDSQAVAFSFPSSGGGTTIVRMNLPNLTLRVLTTTPSSVMLTDWSVPGEITAKDNNGRLSSVNAETGQVTPTN